MEEKEHIHPNQEGTLLGFVGPFWALMYLAALTLVIMLSVFVIGDPNFS